MNGTTKTKQEKLIQLLGGMRRLGLFLLGVGVYVVVLASVFYLLFEAAAKGRICVSDAVFFAVMWATMAQLFVYTSCV